MMKMDGMKKKIEHHMEKMMEHKMKAHELKDKHREMKMDMKMKEKENKKKK